MISGEKIAEVLGAVNPGGFIDTFTDSNDSIVQGAGERHLAHQADKWVALEACRNSQDICLGGAALSVV